MNLLEPYSGHVYEVEWIEYDNKTSKYNPPVTLFVKGQSQIGVQSGIKETILVEEISGKMVEKSTFRVHCVSDNKIKPKDRIKFIDTNETYTVMKVSPDVNHPNNIGRRYISRKENPITIYLGE